MWTQIHFDKYKEEFGFSVNQVRSRNRVPKRFLVFRYPVLKKGNQQKTMTRTRKTGQLLGLEMTLKQMRAFVSLLSLYPSTKSTQSKTKMQVEIHGEEREVFRVFLVIKTIEA